MNLLLTIIALIIAAILGIFAQKVFGTPKPQNYTYLGNSIDSWQADQNREEASSLKSAKFIIIGSILAFFVYCIGDYSSVTKIDELEPQTLEEKTEILNYELRKNAKIEELQNPQVIESKKIIENQIEPVEIQQETKTKERLNSAGVPVDKNGYLQ
jgi:hypothetical protein